MKLVKPTGAVVASASPSEDDRRVQPIPPIRAFRVRFCNPVTGAVEERLVMGHAMGLPGDGNTIVLYEYVRGDREVVREVRLAVRNWMEFTEVAAAASGTVQ